MAVSDSTGGTRAIIASAVSGSAAGEPSKVCPAVTVTRLPSAPSCASRLARDEAEMPSTATAAAIPIAMPRPDSAVRSLRARSPSRAPRASDVYPARLMAVSPARLRAPARLPIPPSLRLLPSSLPRRSFVAPQSSRRRGPPARSWDRSVVGDDPAVLHPDPPVHGRGHGRLAGDHDDGRAAV